MRSPRLTSIPLSPVDPVFLDLRQILTLASGCTYLKVLSLEEVLRVPDYTMEIVAESSNVVARRYIAVGVFRGSVAENGVLWRFYVHARRGQSGDGKAVSGKNA